MNVFSCYILKSYIRFKKPLYGCNITMHIYLSKSVFLRTEKCLWQKHLVFVVLVMDMSLLYSENPARACLLRSVRWQLCTREQVSKELFGGLIFSLNGRLLLTLIMELHQRWEFMTLLLITFICWQLREPVWPQPWGRARLVGDWSQSSAAHAESNRRHNRALAPRALSHPTHKILSVNSL